MRLIVNPIAVPVVIVIIHISWFCHCRIGHPIVISGWVIQVSGGYGLPPRGFATHDARPFSGHTRVRPSTSAPNQGYSTPDAVFYGNNSPFLWNQSVHCRVHNSPTPDSWIQSYIFVSCIFKICIDVLWFELRTHIWSVNSLRVFRPKNLYAFLTTVTRAKYFPNARNVNADLLRLGFVTNTLSSSNY